MQSRWDLAIGLQQIQALNQGQNIHQTTINPTAEVRFVQGPAQEEQSESLNDIITEKSAVWLYLTSHTHNKTPTHSASCSRFGPLRSSLAGVLPWAVMAGCSPNSSFSLLAWILPW